MIAKSSLSEIGQPSTSRKQYHGVKKFVLPHDSEHIRQMLTTFLKLKPLVLGAACVSLIAQPCLAEGQNSRPLETLGREVVVREYPVTDGASREAAAENAVRDVVATRGSPLFQDGSLKDGQVRLVYPDALVVVSNIYSNNIICRIEVPASNLRGGIDTSWVIPLAAGACRATEERGWGAAGHNRPTSIGTEFLPENPSAEVRIYATDQLSGLFPILVRDIELQTSTTASLVRGEDWRDSYQREGAILWRYAWFANGTVLVVRHIITNRDVRGRERVGLTCAVLAPAMKLDTLENGPFSTWCDRQESRLGPGLPDYVRVVTNYRKMLPPKGDGVPAAYGGFHLGAFPVELTQEFWRNGIVPQ